MEKTRIRKDLTSDTVINKEQVCSPTRHENFSTIMEFLQSFREAGETGHYYTVCSVFQHL